MFGPPLLYQKEKKRKSCFYCIPYIKLIDNQWTKQCVKYIYSQMIPEPTSIHLNTPFCLLGDSTSNYVCVQEMYYAWHTIYISNVE